MTSPLPFSKQKGLGTRLVHTLGSLSKDGFEQHMSTGSEAISLLIYPDTTKNVLLSVFTLKDDFPENLGITTVQECKKSTFG